MTVIPLINTNYKMAQFLMIMAALLQFFAELNARVRRENQVDATRRSFGDLFQTRDQNERYIDMAASLLCSPRNERTLDDLKKLNGPLRPIHSSRAILIGSVQSA